MSDYHGFSLVELKDLHRRVSDARAADKKWWWMWSEIQDGLDFIISSLENDDEEGRDDLD
jgi:hypothetical protein